LRHSFGLLSQFLVAQPEMDKKGNGRHGGRRMDSWAGRGGIAYF
jgi:hypothetical protein